MKSIRRRQFNSTLPLPSHPIARSGITRKRRTPSETERAHGSKARRAWMKRQPCVICGRTPCDAAHVKSGGVGRKDNVERTVPLCSDYPDQGCLALGHHSEYDGGKRSFVAKYPVDLLALAAETHRAWLAYTGEAA